MFDWPIATAAERTAAIDGLPGGWINSNPYLTYYEISAGVWNYHDGVDLNLNVPTWNADWHKAIVAIADGVVTFAGVGGGSWGHIVDIKHPLPNGGYVVSRFGHVENTLVKTGDLVTRGQRVASVGNGDGYYGQTGAHLHWNVTAPNDPIMLNSPNQWCGTSKQCVLDHYIDPIQFIIQMKAQERLKTTNLTRSNKVYLYAGPGLTYAVQHGFPEGVSIDVDDQNPKYDSASGLTFYPTPVDGYVEASSVGLPELTGPVSPPANLVGYVSQDGNGLRLRSAASTTAAIVTSMATGTKVEYTSDPPIGSDQFVKVIKVNDAAQAGYCSKKYLQDTRPQ